MRAVRHLRCIQPLQLAIRSQNKDVGFDVTNICISHAYWKLFIIDSYLCCLQVLCVGNGYILPHTTVVATDNYSSNLFPAHIPFYTLLRSIDDANTEVGVVSCASELETTE